MLSDEQEYILELYNKGDNIFITGMAGSGKSWIIKKIVEDARKKGKKVALTAMTGKAAVLLGEGAQTFHSWAGIGLGKGSIQELYQRIVRKDGKDRWIETDLLIIDEVSMMSHYLFYIIYELARRLRPKGLCGSLQVIFSADFCQLPPIGDRVTLESTEYCFQSDLWNTVFPIENQIEFTTNFRQSDKKFQDLLDRVRKGKMLKKDIKVLSSLTKKEYPENYVPCYICPVKRQVDAINTKELNKLETEKREFSVKYSLPEEVEGLTKKEIREEAEKMAKNLPIEQLLTLKIGAQVMCTYNIDMEKGICNGSQGKVVSFKEDLPIVQFTNGVTLKINPIEYEHDIYETIIVTQIPLILAWGCTIHKLQGATLDLARVNAGKDIFERGQLYVALSRVRTLEGLYLTEFDPSALKTDKIVLEFYKQFE